MTCGNSGREEEEEAAAADLSAGEEGGEKRREALNDAETEKKSGLQSQGKKKVDDFPHFAFVCLFVVLLKLKARGP